MSAIVIAAQPGKFVPIHTTTQTYPSSPLATFMLLLLVASTTAPKKTREKKKWEIFTNTTRFNASKMRGV
jgi:hypothetical protein